MISEIKQPWRKSEKGRTHLREYKKTAAWKEKRRRQRLRYKKRYKARENQKRKDVYYRRNYGITFETAQRMKPMAAKPAEIKRELCILIIVIRRDMFAVFYAVRVTRRLGLSKTIGKELKGC